MAYCIYIITNTVNGKKYVGLTNDSSRRQKQHFAAARRGVPGSLYNAIRKHGSDNFEFKVICEEQTIDEAIESEIRLIAHHDSYKSGYNQTKGGDICQWFKAAPENERQQIIDRRADGVRRWSSNRTDEEMDALRTRVANQWMELSESERTTMSKKMASKKAKRYLATSPQGILYDVTDLKAFCRKQGLHQGQMSGVANGRYSHCKGWTIRHWTNGGDI